MEVIDVSDVRRRLERDGPLNVDAGTPERLDLARVVRKQANGADTKEAKAAGGGVV
jgi:hypothetical protein